MKSKWMHPFNAPLEAYFYSWLVDSRYEDPRGVFNLNQGILRISGNGLGYLATHEAYQDYHLSLEYQWGERNWHWGDRVGKARDSGLFLHATGPDGNSHDGNGAFMAAIECNVFQGAVGDFLLIRGDDSDGKLIAPSISCQINEQPDADGWWTFQSGGQWKRLERWGRINHRFKSPVWKDKTDFRAPGDVTVPHAWNRLECRCFKDQILLWVNGVLVNKATQVWPSKGKILIQCEGSEILIRNFQIRQWFE